MSKEVEKEKVKTKITCGLIMPISAIDGYTAEHWFEVKNIIIESVKSIDKYEIEVKLVSDADDIGVIQERIVENVYKSDIVVCDVSAKNPNVMFELGMRLAFDKPTVIIIDNNTGYSFDTGVIEHVGYPKDLRFQPIIDFKNKLASKVLATYEKSISGDDKSFLKYFGTFKVAKLEETIVPANEIMMDMLSDIQREIIYLKRNNNQSRSLSLNELRRDKKYYNEKMEIHEAFQPKEYREARIREEIIQDFIFQNDITMHNIEGRFISEDFKQFLKTHFKSNAIEYSDDKVKVYINSMLNQLQKTV
ncbi:RNA helicase [bacterium]|nr:RNA helicase [bacterium]MBU1435070.1 RNA helicase [bacterium]MBU1504175.1 RNA helicase [bacterium]MBU3938165.1 RNA helicase [bacterium]MBU4023953.1 RNA helicase [bacterium]